MRLQLLYVQGTKQEELMKASTSSLNSQSTTRSVSTAQSAELRSNTSSPVPLSQMKPVQAVAPHVTKTKTAKNKQCQTDREDKVKPLVPTNLEGLAEELTVFLKKAGGIRITVSPKIRSSFFGFQIGFQIHMLKIHMLNAWALLALF
ncbi:hypothetical protein L596_026770 [Steinernema carpocapsae]|uniref:Uncharacterized protein n=1 Tax=Steinernema carpocapsae TaxID=34508 RepID=A0A4U5M2C9_STECR|nr:hypothetical protein L596_026770 [Steinernema carpocapsae]